MCDPVGCAGSVGVSAVAVDAWDALGVALLSLLRSSPVTVPLQDRPRAAEAAMTMSAVCRHGPGARETR